MLAFQRRYDEALLRARKLLRANAIGRLFKTLSVLEDPEPPPPGYQSPGLLADMAVHNADEILWLGGGTPTAITGVGARLHNQRIPGVVEEDFDDVFVQMWFGGEATAQIQVSRNHVAGYRNETFLYGAEGLIHVGHFDEDPLRDYGEPVPVFIRRFGKAYKAEVADFVAKCRAGEPFAVTHRHGLRAMEVVIAGAGAVRGPGQAAPIRFPSDLTVWRAIAALLRLRVELVFLILPWEEWE